MISQQLFCFVFKLWNHQQKNHVLFLLIFEGRTTAAAREIHALREYRTEKKCNITRTDHCDAASELFSWSEQLRGFFELPWPFHRRFLWKITEKRMNSSSSIKRRRIITKMLCQNWLFKAETQPENNHFACHQVGVPHYPNLQKTTAWPEHFTLKFNFEVKSNRWQILAVQT